MRYLSILAGLLLSCAAWGQAGCTDPAATNYDSSATEDNGTCAYCAEGEVALIIEMADSAGDGWEGAFYSILSENGTSFFGSLDDASTGDGLSAGTDVLCLPEGCYALTIIGPPGEIAEVGVNIYEFGGLTIHEGEGAWGPMLFHGSNTVNCGILDCMDPNCINYNPFATEDDGSCVCVTCEGDLDGDGMVNAADILEVLGMYGSDGCDWPCIADINGDGEINTEDLLSLVGSIGIICSFE